MGGQGRRPTRRESGPVTIRILELKQDTAAQFWPELAPFVRRALNFDAFNQMKVSDIEQQVTKGFARVLICTEGEQLLAAHILQLFKAIDGERVLHVLCTAGDDSHRWMADVIDHLDAMAELEGATAITMSGRPGWAKKLTRLGFRTQQIQMRKAVNGQQKPAAIAVN